MKCHACHINIPAGVAAAKMIVDYLQADQTVKTFGYMMPDGPLTEATGRILRGYHHKCFWIRRKREARGDAVTGRVVGWLPSGYQIDDLVHDAGTRKVSAQIDVLREVARRVGKGVGDPTVTEAYRAEQHGGPYPHSHEFRLDTYQLGAHLRYAHGTDVTGTEGWHALHEQLHARAALDATTVSRAADIGHTDQTEADWRSQLVLDAADLTTKDHHHAAH